MAEDTEGSEGANPEAEGRTILERDREAVAYLADIETIRHYDIVQFEFYDKIDDAAGTTADVIESSRLKPGWTYEVLNMVAYNAGSGISQATMGYMSGATFMIQHKGSTDNPFHTVEFHHHVMLKEGDRIRCEFANATADDNLFFYANGIKRRM